jgi:hypothetical protein
VADDREEIDRDLQVLEVELKQLEAEYNMFFAGRLPRPPWETRARVEGLVKRLDRRHIANYGQRFRFTALQTRVARFIDLWDRALRAREEGRAGPLAPPRAATPAEPGERAAGRPHVTTFRDPAREQDKLRDLYQQVAEARRKAGQDAIPYQKFAELVKNQVSALKEKGGAGVTFKVAVKEGKVAFTAKPVKDGGAKKGKKDGD